MKNLLNSSKGSGIEPLALCIFSAAYQISCCINFSTLSKNTSVNVDSVVYRHVQHMAVLILDLNNLYIVIVIDLLIRII